MSCTREENKELFERIIAGDESAKERFTTGNMAYVVMAAKDYVKKRPQFKYLQDDLISEGYLTLIDLSKKIRHSENPQGFLTTGLIRAFNKLTTKEKNKAVESLDKNMLWENKKRTRNEVLIACEDNLEKQIMTLHLDCHTDQEIADTLGMKRYQILRIRMKIKKRLQK